MKSSCYSGRLFLQLLVGGYLPDITVQVAEYNCGMIPPSIRVVLEQMDKILPREPVAMSIFILRAPEDLWIHGGQPCPRITRHIGLGFGVNDPPELVRSWPPPSARPVGVHMDRVDLFQ